MCSPENWKSSIRSSAALFAHAQKRCVRRLRPEDAACFMRGRTEGAFIVNDGRMVIFRWFDGFTRLDAYEIKSDDGFWKFIGVAATGDDGKENLAGAIAAAVLNAGPVVRSVIFL